MGLSSPLDGQLLRPGHRVYAAWNPTARTARSSATASTDIVAAGEMAMLNFDMARFHGKAVADLADAVGPNGGFTETAPFVGISDDGLVPAEEKDRAREVLNMPSHPATRALLQRQER